MITRRLAAIAASAAVLLLLTPTMSATRPEPSTRRSGLRGRRDMRERCSDPSRVVSENGRRSDGGLLVEPRPRVAELEQEVAALRSREDGEHRVSSQRASRSAQGGNLTSRAGRHPRRQPAYSQCHGS